MQQKICYIMLGVSGSGKTSAIKKLSNIHQNLSIGVFSLDTCRLNFLSEFLKQDKEYSTLEYSNVSEKDTYSAAFKFANENQKSFDEYVNEDWKKALTKQIVFVDNMNLSKKSRARWIAESSQKGFEVVAVQMHTPLHVCKDRQSSRTDKELSPSLIEDMYMRFQEVKVPEEVSYIIHVDGVTGEMIKH